MDPFTACPYLVVSHHNLLQILQDLIQVVELVITQYIDCGNLKPFLDSRETTDERSRRHPGDQSMLCASVFLWSCSHACPQTDEGQTILMNIPAVIGKQHTVWSFLFRLCSSPVTHSAVQYLSLHRLHSQGEMKVLVSFSLYAALLFV